MQRSSSITVSVVFVTLIVGVPLLQTAVELGRGQRPRFLAIFSRAPTAENLRSFEASLQDASVAARALRGWMQFAQFFLLEKGERTVVGEDGWLFYLPSVEYVTQRPPDKPPAFGDPCRAIVDFRDQLAARGIHLVIVPAPNKESIYPEKLTCVEDGIDFIVPRETRALLDRLQMAGVDVVDLFETFAAAKRGVTEETAPELYLQRDTHWSPHGMELAAREVARHLLDHDWIVRGQTAYNSRPVTCEHVGDLVRMLQVPRIELSLAPQVITCTQVTGAAGEPYADDPQAAVLVLGDSFLRIYQQDAPRSAGFVAHLARELNQPVASIINDGGASTLVRQQLARRPSRLANKKVVIWEFVERDIRYGMEGWQLIDIPSSSAPSELEEEGSSS